MTDLKTTEAEQKRVEEAAQATLDIGFLYTSPDFVLRLLADFATLQEQLAQADAEIYRDYETEFLDGMILDTAINDACARHQSRQQAAKEGK